MNRSKFQAAVCFVVVFLTPAMQPREISPALRSAMNEMKNMTQSLTAYMKNESTCAPDIAEGPRTVGCIKESAENIEVCDILTYDTYFTEAINLNVTRTVTDRLRAIKQYMQGLRRKICKAAPVANCKVGFTEQSDGDYEKFCKVLILVELFKQWLERIPVTKNRKKPF